MPGVSGPHSAEMESAMAISGFLKILKMWRYYLLRRKTQHFHIRHRGRRYFEMDSREWYGAKRPFISALHFADYPLSIGGHEYY